ncbi:hypothetical protein WA158_001379 [Blastocystis sp. Blastoise]
MSDSEKSTETKKRISYNFDPDSHSSDPKTSQTTSKPIFEYAPKNSSRERRHSFEGRNRHYDEKKRDYDSKIEKNYTPRYRDTRERYNYSSKTFSREQSRSDATKTPSTRPNRDMNRPAWKERRQPSWSHDQFGQNERNAKRVELIEKRNQQNEQIRQIIKQRMAERLKERQNENPSTQTTEVKEVSNSLTTTTDEKKEQTQITDISNQNKEMIKNDTTNGKDLETSEQETINKQSEIRTEDTKN